MSGAKKETGKTYALTGPWASAWKAFAGIGVLGLIGSALGYVQNPQRFAFSWLFGFITVLTVALGAIFFVLIQRLTSAGWSVTVRRTAEFYGLGVIALLPLFLPVVLCMNMLFPWLHRHSAGPGESPHAGLQLVKEAHAGQAPTDNPGHDQAPPHEPEPAAGHGVPAHGAGDPVGHLPGSKAGIAGTTATGHAGVATGRGHGVQGPMGDPHAFIHEEILAKKAPYLNRTFFLIRVAIYFIAWIFIALRLFGYSTKQDTSRSPSLTLAAQRFAPAATMLYALTLTGAAVDWIMSLEPTWFSTIFGVLIFATGVVSSLATLILTTHALKTSGPLEGAVTVEHFHDMGKLMFGFLVFWAYIHFSQFMLIWYAALPEETTFYHNRWDYEPWANVSFAIVLFHFAVPFFWTMSRNFKRNTSRLQVGAAILLVMHVVDIYWFIMPNAHLGKPGFSFSWIDAACLFANVGIYGAFVFHRMTQHSLVPVGDPRLERALHFQNA